MKFGSQTGSLINHVMTNTIQEVPPVGAGATRCGWSDRSPMTVFAVRQVGKAIIVECRDDAYTRIDTNGMSEAQVYTYQTMVNGNKSFYRRNNKTGAWESVHQNTETGRWVKSRGRGVVFGHRERFYDFSF